MPTHRLRVLTNSELRTHRRCSTEHHFAYELGYRAATDDAAALRFGTAIHLGLEGWWRAPRGERLLRAYAMLADAELDAFDLARVIELLHGYDVRWGAEPYEALIVPAASADASGIRINPHTLVEAQFLAPLVNPATGKPSRTFELGGKLDVLALNLEDGRVYIIEHKTSSEDITAGSQYWQLLRLDTQISTYYAGARAMGFDPAGVVYDVIGKPKLRPYVPSARRAEPETPDEYQLRVREAIANDPDRYFARGMVVRLERDEADAQWDTWQHARLIREAEIGQRWPRNPDSCKRYGRMCAYFDVCTGAARLDDTTRFRHTDNVHEELTLDTTHDTTPGDSSSPSTDAPTNDPH